MEYSYKQSPKLLTQVQYCEESVISVSLVLGDSELQRGVVRVRDVRTRADSEVPSGALVEHLRALLRSTATVDSVSDSFITSKAATSATAGATNNANFGCKHLMQLLYLYAYTMNIHLVYDL